MGNSLAIYNRSSCNSQMAEEIETMSSSLSEDTPSQSQAPAPAPALSSFPAFSNEYKVHAYNRNGICSLGFMDDHYPVRSAFSLLNQVLDEYQKNFGDTWKTVQADSTQPWPYLNEA